MRKFTLRSRTALVLLTLVVAIGFAVSGCLDRSETPVKPETTSNELLLSFDNPVVVEAMAVQEHHTPRLMKKPGVVGTAVGATPDNKPAILILAANRGVVENLPTEIDGYPVIVKVTGPIVAYKGGPPNQGPDHTARQNRPIELGVSGGNANDLANGFCCSGTLGALVESGGTQYILSNSHVFAGDIASSGGDPDVSQIGDPINQPGLIDVQCQDIANDYVANLSTLSTLAANPPSGNVDAALAEVISGTVRSDGSILEIGVLSSSTVAASIDQAVKKSGRTTGLTRSSVEGLNATVNVGYSDECAGNSFTRQFTGQIFITNRGSKFLNSGDSGSLMVEDVTNNPRAVGLLYAGGGNIAVANPIGDVLSHFGVSMVGN